MAGTKTFLGFHWACAKHVGSQLWEHRRAEFVSTLVLSVGAFVAGIWLRDTGAKKSFEVSLITAVVWLGIFAVYYLVTAPWKVHRGPDHANSLGWGHGVTCVVIIGLLVFFVYEMTVTMVIGSTIRYVAVYGAIENYGLTKAGNVLVEVNTAPFNDVVDKQSLFLAYRLADYTIDPKNDLTLEKSGLFEITGARKRIESKMSDAMLYRIAKNHGGTLEFFLVLFPKNQMIDRVTTLGALEGLHGQVVGGQTMTVGADLYVPLTGQTQAQPSKPPKPPKIQEQ